MPPARLPHDPFTTSTTAGVSLRPQASHTSLRSNASSASTRTRQQSNLFAPTLSRRPTSRTRVEDDVLADSESEDRSIISQRQRPQMRKRHASPKTMAGRMKSRPQPEEQDIVNRQADGNYLPVPPGVGVGVSMAPPLPDAPDDEEENTKALDKHYAAVARHYFTSNAHAGGRQSKQTEDEFEREKNDLVVHLRQQVMHKLEDERWLYEPVDRMGM